MPIHAHMHTHMPIVCLYSHLISRAQISSTKLIANSTVNEKQEKEAVWGRGGKHQVSFTSLKELGQTKAHSGNVRDSVSESGLAETLHLS